MADRSTHQRGVLRSAIAIASLSAPLAVAGCSSTAAFDAPFADYLQRTALVSTAGGDAQAANVALQTATPWPRYVNDTNIPGNGARMVRAVTRYESGSASASESAPPTSANSGANPGSGATNGASTGMAPSLSAQPSGY